MAQTAFSLGKDRSESEICSVVLSLVLSTIAMTFQGIILFYLWLFIKSWGIREVIQSVHRKKGSWVVKAL